MTVQLRPPKRATANVYGRRRVRLTSVGTATSVKSSAVEKRKPALFRLTAVTLQRTQTEKARNSAKMEKVMLRRATALPRVSQNWSSSGFQSAIHGLATRLPLLGGRAPFRWLERQSGPGTARSRECLREVSSPCLECFRSPSAR